MKVGVMIAVRMNPLGLIWGPDLGTCFSGTNADVNLRLFFRFLNLAKTF